MTRRRIEVPQADDLFKIAELPAKVEQGIDSIREWSEHYSVHVRIGRYYADAVRMLGMVSIDGDALTLTTLGRRYLELGPRGRVELLERRLHSMSWFRGIAREIGPMGLATGEIASWLEKSFGLSRSTAKRRAGCVFAHFKWLARNMGSYQITDGRLFKTAPRH